MKLSETFMSEETMSSISEKSGSFISPHESGSGRINGLPHLMVSKEDTEVSDPDRDM